MHTLPPQPMTHSMHVPPAGVGGTPGHHSRAGQAQRREQQQLWRDLHIFFIYLQWPAQGPVQAQRHVGPRGACPAT